MLKTQNIIDTEINNKYVSGDEEKGCICRENNTLPYLVQTCTNAHYFIPEYNQQAKC
jgi:hypothetical protein